MAVFDASEGQARKPEIKNTRETAADGDPKNVAEKKVGTIAERLLSLEDTETPLQVQSDRLNAQKTVLMNSVPPKFLEGSASARILKKEEYLIRNGKLGKLMRCPPGMSDSPIGKMIELAMKTQAEKMRSEIPPELRDKLYVGVEMVPEGYIFYAPPALFKKMMDEDAAKFSGEDPVKTESKQAKKEFQASLKQKSVLDPTTVGNKPHPEFDIRREDLLRQAPPDTKDTGIGRVIAGGRFTLNDKQEIDFVIPAGSAAAFRAAGKYVFGDNIVKANAAVTADGGYVIRLNAEQAGNALKRFRAWTTGSSIEALMINPDNQKFLRDMDKDHPEVMQAFRSGEGDPAQLQAIATMQDGRHHLRDFPSSGKSKAAA